MCIDTISSLYYTNAILYWYNTMLYWVLIQFVGRRLNAGQAAADFTKCAVKDCRLLFQKASTKILLYLMAMGHTVASRSKAPLLNMTQYSLLTQVPSGKMRRGVVSWAATWAFILSPTTLRSFTYKCRQALMMLCLSSSSHPLLCGPSPVHADKP